MLVLYHAALIFAVQEASSQLLFLEDDDAFDQQQGNYILQLYLQSECENCFEIGLVVYPENMRSPLCDSFMSKLNRMHKPHIAIGLRSDGNYSYSGGEYDYRPDSQVVFLDETNCDVGTMLAMIEEAPFLNVRGKLLLVVTSNKVYRGFEGGLRSWAEETFKAAWSLQILRTTILVPRSGTAPLLLKYNPFKKQYWIETEDDGDSFADYKRPVSDMHGYPLKLYHFNYVFEETALQVPGTSEWVGSDGKYFDAISRALNASLMVHKISEDFSRSMVTDADPTQPLSQFISLFKEMFDFDFLMNIIPVAVDNYMDHVFTYERIDVFVYVPNGKKIPEYLYILMAVRPEVWVIVLTAWLLTSAIMAAVARASLSTVLSNNFRYILNTAAPSPTATGYFRERLLFALWLFHCMIFTTMFHSMLTSTLVVPKYYPNLETLQDLYRTDLKVYGSLLAVHQIKTIADEEQQQLVDRLVAVPRNVTLFGEDLDWIPRYTANDSVILVHQKQLYELSRTMKLEYYTIQQSPFPRAPAFNIPRNKLYYEEVLTVYGRIESAGLKLYWERYEYDLGKVIERRRTDSGGDGLGEVDDDTLKLKHLHSALVILLLGHGLAAVAFLCEASVGRRRQRRRIGILK